MGVLILGIFYVKLIFALRSKICLTKDVTFLNKSCGDWHTVEKSIIIPISYEELDEEEVEMFPQNNDYNTYYNAVSDFDIDKEKEKEGENIFEPEIDDELEVTTRPL